MSNYKNELKQILDERASNLYQKIIQSKLTTPERIKGCSESEIAKTEQTYSELCLPYSYKVFLRYFGHGIGPIATDLKFLYPDFMSFTRYQKEIDREIQEDGDFSPEELIPKNAFVFAMRQTMEFYYFLAEEGVEDPPIFFDEVDGSAARKIQNSIFDFWETEVEYKEQFIAESKEREKRIKKEENT